MESLVIVGIIIFVVILFASIYHIHHSVHISKIAVDHIKKEVVLNTIIKNLL